MGRIVCISNQKGGVGKTTTAINLAASLAAAERKTLLIDLDPQGNAGSGLGIDRTQLQGSIYDALINDVPLAELLQPTELRFLEVVPATADLTGAEVELVGMENRELRLRHALEPLKRKYDFILIDCPPSLGLLTLNALAAAHEVLIPLQTEYYAMEGLAQLMSTVELVQKHLNPRLTVEGIVFTMYDPRANISKGGRSVPLELGETELAIIAALRDKLIADGMFLVGIDVIGSQVVEINAESPGGFQSVERLYGIDIAETVIEALERRASPQP